MIRIVKNAATKLIVFIITFLLTFTLLIPSIKVGAYGPSVMYTGTNPAPGYPRAIQLQYNGANNGKMLAVFDHNVAAMPTFCWKLHSFRLLCNQDRYL